MVEKIYNKPYFNRRNFILEELEHLDLSCLETLILLCIDFDKENNALFDVETCARKLKVDPDEVDQSMQQLIEKGYLEVTMQQRSIVYSIDGVFKVKDNLEVMTNSEYRTIFDMFEDAFARTLSPQESQRLGEWMTIYELKLIEYALREAIVYEKRSFDYVNAILHHWKEQNIGSKEYEEGKR